MFKNDPYYVKREWVTIAQRVPEEFKKEVEEYIKNLNKKNGTKFTLNSFATYCIKKVTGLSYTTQDEFIG